MAVLVTLAVVRSITTITCVEVSVLLTSVKIFCTLVAVSVVVNVEKEVKVLVVLVDVVEVKEVDVLVVVRRMSTKVYRLRVKNSVGARKMLVVKVL